MADANYENSLQQPIGRILFNRFTGETFLGFVLACFVKYDSDKYLHHPLEDDLLLFSNPFGYKIPGLDPRKRKVSPNTVKLKGDDRVFEFALAAKNFEDCADCITVSEEVGGSKCPLHVQLEYIDKCNDCFDDKVCIVHQNLLFMYETEYDCEDCNVEGNKIIHLCEIHQNAAEKMGYSTEQEQEDPDQSDQEMEYNSDNGELIISDHIPKKIKISGKKRLKNKK